MPSPFPGMDPYIEACDLWENFHHALIEKIADALEPALPENYVARSAERAYIVLVESEGNHYATYLLMAKAIDEGETQRRLDFYLELDARLIREPNLRPMLH